jgi:hypothetical protein
MVVFGGEVNGTMEKLGNYCMGEGRFKAINFVDQLFVSISPPPSKFGPITFWFPLVVAISFRYKIALYGQLIHPCGD